MRRSDLGATFRFTAETATFFIALRLARPATRIVREIGQTDHTRVTGEIDQESSGHRSFCRK
jgi:hypothetical protein